jgi:hypothetical protein
MSILWIIKYVRRTYVIMVLHNENRLNIHVNENILCETYKNLKYQQKSSQFDFFSQQHTYFYIGVKCSETGNTRKTITVMK